MIIKILIVCTGNTCRSSMAKLIAADLLTRMGQAGQVEIISRGTMALPGQRASVHAIKVMDKRGLDLSSHQAALLAVEDIRAAEVIIAMTFSHQEQIITMSPEAAEKITVLNVPDPFGGEEEDYEACARKIEAQLREILTRFFSE